MKTKKVVRKIFDTLNYSKKLKISSILPDRDSDYAILLELEDGSKFEIIIIPREWYLVGTPYCGDLEYVQARIPE